MKWSLLLLPLLCVVGCNLFAPLYLFSDRRQPAEFDLIDLAKKDEKEKKKKPITVAVITHADLGSVIELGHLARELDSALTIRLAESLKDSRDIIKLTSSRTVHKWQDSHDNWSALEPEEVAESLAVDYLLYVTVERPQIYEERSRKTLYHGRADVTLRFVKTGMEEEDSVEAELKEKKLDIEFPRGGRPVQVDSAMPPDRFRREFVDEIAKQLSWYFIPHDTMEEFARDGLGTR
jgi:predicted small lipoprotein YifL